MTDATATSGPASIAPAPKLSFTEKHGVAMPYLLAAAYRWRQDGFGHLGIKRDAGQFGKLLPQDA